VLEPERRNTQLFPGFAKSWLWFNSLSFLRKNWEKQGGHHLR